jgi:hypothetical protein
MPEIRKWVEIDHAWYPYEGEGDAGYCLHLTVIDRSPKRCELLILRRTDEFPGPEELGLGVFPEPEDLGFKAIQYPDGKLDADKTQRLLATMDSFSMPLTSMMLDEYDYRGPGGSYLRLDNTEETCITFAWPNEWKSIRDLVTLFNTLAEAQGLPTNTDL